jgi:hypothetical protein
VKNIGGYRSLRALKLGHLATNRQTGRKETVNLILFILRVLEKSGVRNVFRHNGR